MIQDDPTQIDPKFDAVKHFYQSGQTRSMRFRKTQLEKLLRGIEDLEREFHAALDEDLGVKKFGSVLSSTLITKLDVEHNLKNLDRWAQPEFRETPLVVGPGQSKVVYEPLGVVLVMSAWNYPLYTAIPPMAAAIAAGNCVILKPSEMAPKTSRVLKVLVEKYLDPNAFAVVEGGVEVAKCITSKPFDLIIFTGSPEKGRLVARAASANLTPCLLELGGKSPTIVCESADLEVAAQRVVQGRFLNCGQTCIACDYVLVHRRVKDQFVELLKKYIVQFYGQDPSKSQDYSRIVNRFHTNRLIGMLHDHGGQVLHGGSYDQQRNYVEPTLILQPRNDSSLMQEEIFGPILPICTYDSIHEVVAFINARPKPLALYYFGTNRSHFELLEHQTSSGVLVVNDAVFQVLNHHLPFGGVGNSGYGAYHGLDGFRACSHPKPVFHKSTLNCYPLNQRYPPYTPSRQRVLLFLFKFSHVTQEKVHRGVLTLMAALGVYYLNKKGKLDYLKEGIQQVGTSLRESYRSLAKM